jgi:hypothetical protein
MNFATTIWADVFSQSVFATFEAFTEKPCHYFSLLKLPVPPDFVMFVTTA